MKSSRQIYFGLDIQKEYLTLAQYAPDDRSVMLVAIQPFDNPSDNSPAEPAGNELRNLKRKFKFSNNSINCALPVEYAIIKKVPVDRDEKDVENALQWELGQQIIRTVDEYAFDYQAHGRDENGLEEYLLVGYHRERVNEITALFKKNRLVPGVVDLDVFALINVFEANYPDFAEQLSLLVHAEGEKAKLVLTHGGRYVDHECIWYEYGPGPEIFAERLKREAERICSSPALPNSMSAVPVFAAGALFSQPGFLETVASVTGSISLLHPFRKVGCRVGVDEEQLQGYLTQLAVAVGLALREDE